MSQLGFPAALLGGRFGEALPQAAAGAQQLWAQQAGLTPDLLFQGLARAADARQRAAELTAKLKADQAAGLREALSTALSDYARSQSAAENRSAAAREGGLERASRERIAEADRTARAADRDEYRQTQIDVANIGADSRRYAVDERGGGAVGKTTAAVYQEMLSARLANDQPREARAGALLQDMGRNALNAAATPEEKQAVINEFNAIGIRLDQPPPPAARPTPAESPGMLGRAIGYWPQAVGENLSNAMQSMGEFGASVLGTDTNKPPTAPLGTVTPPSWLSQYTDPIGGAVEGAGLALRRWLGLDRPEAGAMQAQPVEPTGPGNLTDFYRSMDRLPPPASQPVPLLPPQPDPWSNYNWLTPRR